MTDKKSCANCMNNLAYCRDCELNPKLTARQKVSNNHIRDSHKWLSILPTAPGWYWWRQNERYKPVIIECFSSRLEMPVAKFMDERVEILETLGGEFQGPIEPNNEGEK